MADAFADFQARVRAGERLCAESDLYWRTNRWAIGGSSLHVPMPEGEFVVIAAFDNVGRSTYQRNGR